jgi:hypothetical protein
MYSATFSIDSDGMTIAGSIACYPPGTQPGASTTNIVPTVALVEVDVSAAYTWAKNSKDGEDKGHLSLFLACGVLIEPPAQTKLPDAWLSG